MTFSALFDDFEFFSSRVSQRQISQTRVSKEATPRLKKIACDDEALDVRPVNPISI
jgi:hypothetical protein